MIEAVVAGWLSLLNPQFPDSQFLLLPWRESRDIVISRNESPDSIPRENIRCENDNIWPTHPQQYTKEYHFGVWAPYDHGRLAPNSHACQRANPTNRFCVLATYANVIVMSDLFSDECGNFYRGYWSVEFLKADESMGTLLSKGRTVYPKVDSDFPGEFVTGDTYMIKETEFLFFSGITNQDLKNIRTSQQQALKEGYISSKFHWKKP